MQISITKTNGRKAFRSKVVVMHVNIPFLFSFHDEAETANDGAADFVMIIQVCYSKDSTLGGFILHHIPLSSAVSSFFFFFFFGGGGGGENKKIFSMNWWKTHFWGLK